MQLLDGRLIHTATDLASFLGCAYRAVLVREAALGHLLRPTREDPVLARLAVRGHALEADWVARVRAAGREVVEVPRAPRATGLADLEGAADQTFALMRTGTDVIVQGVLFDGEWLGYADILERVAVPSALGDFSYEVADTKLRGHVHAGAVIQLAQYTSQVASLVGMTPTAMHVDLGDGRRVTVPVSHAASFHRRLRDRYLATVRDAVGLEAPSGAGAPAPLVPVGDGRGRDGTPYPWVVPACRTCPWAEACIARRVADDHLAAVPGMRRDHARRLHAGGVETRRELAAIDPREGVAVADRVAIPAPVLDRHRQAAQLSVDLTDNGRDRAVIVDVPASDPPRGIWRVPEPDTGDAFLHVEQDPYRHGRRFTFAAATRNDGRDSTVQAVVQASDDVGEVELLRATVRALLPVLEARRRQPSDGSPRPHVFLWGEAPLVALRAAAVRHGTGERDLQRLVDARVFIDLRSVARESIRTARPVDGLPDLDRYAGITGLPTEAPLLAYDRMVAGEAGASADLDATMGATVERLARVRDWLVRERRARGAAPVSRGVTDEKSSQDETFIRDAIVSMLNEEKARRRAGGNDGEREARAVRLLADLLRWHRREDGVQWTEYFGAMEADGVDLVEHPTAIGGLQFKAESRRGLRRYHFPRGQEYRISVGDAVACRAWGGTPTLVVDAIDGQAGTIDLHVKEYKAWLPTEVDAIIPVVTAASMPLRTALARLARSVDDLGDDPLASPGKYRAARRLLLGETPGPPGGRPGDPLVRPGEGAGAALRRLAMTLDEAALPVQGPPGTGKTHAGAWAILDMLAAGKRVGICAHSHRAIGNLLDATMDAAAEAGMSIKAMQRARPDQRCRSAAVELASNSAQARQALVGGRCQLFAGTAWLFASTGFDGALDALFIDEAGQMSLANALAATTSAHQVFLLGDPRQLAQPVRADHPDGVDASALAHLVGDYETVPDDRGIFLPVSWRMHPEICAFISEQVYESRLVSHQTCERQSIGAREPGGAPVGSGLRRLNVRHAGNRVESREEVLAVAAACTSLLGVPWTDQDGLTRPLEPRDLIVVAPYNRQVDLLNQMLPPGVVAGTVDRFQGQEAAVVFYSMTASDADDLSRGIEFLFGLDRLNVAISRARALAVLVHNPDLLIASCRTGDDVRLANAVCRLAELATPFK